MNKMTKSKKLLKTIKEFFAQGGSFAFNKCKAGSGDKWFTVNIGFSHSENEEDETQFDIHAWNVSELHELFEEFVRENGFKDINILYVEVVDTASKQEDLA